MDSVTFPKAIVAWPTAQDFLFPPYLYPNDLYAFGPNFSYQVIPEPSLFALLAIGAGVLCLRYKSGRNRI
jgi:hypothetical protein